MFPSNKCKDLQAMTMINFRGSPDCRSMYRQLLHRLSLASSILNNSNCHEVKYHFKNIDNLRYHWHIYFVFVDSTTSTCSLSLLNQIVRIIISRRVGRIVCNPLSDCLTVAVTENWQIEGVHRLFMLAAITAHCAKTSVFCYFPSTWNLDMCGI